MDYVVLDTDVASLSFRRRLPAGLAAWLSGFALVDSSHQAALIWGMLSADGKRRGRARPINDTWIAACCLAEGLPLATLNVKDYADFAEHHGLALIRG